MLENMSSELEFEPVVPGLCVECQDLYNDYKVDLLIVSIKNGHADCVKACLVAGTDINFYKNKISNNLLPKAVMNGYDDCVEVLIKAGAEITYESLRKAAEHGSGKCVRLILESGGDPDVMLSHLALDCANEPWLQERFKILIQAGARVKWWTENQAFAKAVKDEKLESMKLLLQAGADVDSPRGNPALVTAVKDEKLESMKLLLRAGADVNSSNGALMIASAKGSDKCVHALLDAGAYVNKVFKGRSALSVAAMKGSSRCVDLLLKSGADVNFRDNKGRSPLHHAVNSTNVQSVKLLLKTGADVNSTDNKSNPVLFLSPIWFSVRRLNCYKLLLNAGVKVNIRNNHGFSAMTNFLKNLADDERYKRSRTVADVKLEEEFVMLLLAAVEKVDETRVGKVSEYMNLSAEVSLMNICRKFIRKDLLQMSDVNLVHKVLRLSLPHCLISCMMSQLSRKK